MDDKNNKQYPSTKDNEIRQWYDSSIPLQCDGTTHLHSHRQFMWQSQPQHTMKSQLIQWLLNETKMSWPSGRKVTVHEQSQYIHYSKNL